MYFGGRMREGNGTAGVNIPDVSPPLPQQHEPEPLQAAVEQPKKKRVKKEPEPLQTEAEQPKIKRVLDIAKTLKDPTCVLNQLCRTLSCRML